MSPGAVRDALTAMWGDTCYICGALLVVSHIEHVRPRSAGGGDSWANLRLSCPSCNWSKGAKSLKDFLAGRDGPVARSAKRAGRYPSPGQMRTAELRPTAASFARHPGYAAAAVAVAAAGVAAVVWWRRRRAAAGELSEQAGEVIEIAETGKMAELEAAEEPISARELLEARRPLEAVELRPPDPPTRKGT